MEKNQLFTRRDFLKVAILGGLAACSPIDPNSPSFDPNSTEIDPTQTEFAKITSATFESITNNETKKSIIDSPPSSRPESNLPQEVKEKLTLLQC